ncbi:MAG: alpha/beta hydrolase [bacterium]|nr:alpha/beta hydrolase [bacterium]
MIDHHFEHGMYIRELAVGQPQGTILYVHGLGESGLCLEELIADPRLRNWHHLAPDLPGYGKSPWPAEPLKLAEHADTLGEWVISRLSGPLVVFGHSMGGVIGLLLCERWPFGAGDERLRGFINVEGNISIEDCGFSSKAAGDTAEDFLAHGMERLLATLYEDGLSDPALRTYYPSVRICDPRAYHLNSTELVALSRAEVPAPRLAALEVPMVYILGLPHGTGEYSRRLLGAAAVEWRAVEGAGHWPFLDQQDACVEEMLRFLRRLAV